MVEQKRAQLEHRLAHARVWRMSPLRSLSSTRSCTRASIRREPVRAEQPDWPRRQLVRVQHARADGIVDVVVDVRHAVDELHDPALERRGHRLTGVGEDPVAHLVGQVQALPVALDHVDHAQRMLVVAEAAVEARMQGLVERLLACMAERRVAEVVPEADRLRQILVQPQRARDRARDAHGLDRVREPGAVVVALRGDEDLRLVLEAPERLRVHDAVAVALERGAQRAWLLVVVRPAPRGVRAHGERTEASLVGGLDALAEAFCDRPRRMHSCSLVVGFRAAQAPGSIGSASRERRRTP